MHARHDSTSLPARDAMRSSESELAVRVHATIASERGGLIGSATQPANIILRRPTCWLVRAMARALDLKSGLQLLDDVRRSRWLSKANFSATGGGCLGGQNGLG